MTTLTFGDIIGQEIEHNPYTFYQKLREQGSLSSTADFGGMGGAWIATNYGEISWENALLKDRKLFLDWTQGIAHPPQGPEQEEA